MSDLLKEISKSGFPEDFQQEIGKSALHLMYQHNNKNLINIESIKEFDDLLEKDTEDKLKNAEKIFSNIEAKEKPVEDNNEEIIL